MKLPEKGVSREELFARLEAYAARDLDTHGGRTWAYVYDSGRREIEEVAEAAYIKFLWRNALDPTAFPSCVQLENELSAIAAEHLNGGPECVGSFTSGGTESCMLAVKTARDYFRAVKPEITEPEMILPVTAHAAFHKAAHYLGVKKVLVPVDEQTFKADPAAVEAAVTPNTILIVGSAVSYAHGVIDPIAELGRIALEHDLLFHVDACVGGWLLPYFKRLGAPVTDFDFSVPGVSSISMDWHKYAYCPKGASIVLYRNKELRRHQFFACAQWTGYTVINSTIQSSKGGGPVAAAWATINFVGDDGYLEIARRSLEATERIVAAIEEIPELRLLGRPEFCLIAFTSDEVSVFNIIDEMKERAWYVQPQLGFSGSKENIHLSVSAVSLERTEEMLADLRECVALAKERPSEGAAEMLQGVLADLEPGRLDAETLSRMLALAGIQDGTLPERMAEINEILNSLPPELKERLLIEFFNDLFHLKSPAG